MYYVGLENFKRAIRFAEKVHCGQMYGDFPYSKHLNDVDNVLVRFGYFHNWELRIAGVLHDVIEDSKDDVKIDVRNAIIVNFGVDMVNLVDSVTDGEGKNRKERKASVYQKLKNNRTGKIIKLADRIANLEWSLLTNLSLLKMYIKEHPDFVSVLYNFDDGLDLMWDHLDYLIALGHHALKIQIDSKRAIEMDPDTTVDSDDDIDQLKNIGLPIT